MEEQDIEKKAPVYIEKGWYCKICGPDDRLAIGGCEDCLIKLWEKPSLTQDEKNRLDGKTGENDTNLKGIRVYKVIRAYREFINTKEAKELAEWVKGVCNVGKSAEIAGNG